MFEIDGIDMMNCRGVGPMKMTIDLRDGMPVEMQYTVRGKKTGKIYRFQQRLLKRAI